jgi:hypothetical protein
MDGQNNVATTPIDNTVDNNQYGAGSLFIFSYFSIVLLFSLFVSLSVSLSLCLSFSLSLFLSLFTRASHANSLRALFPYKSLSPFVLSFSLLVIFSPLVLLAQTRSWHPLAACAKGYAH